jgi:TPR repeat protein
MVSVMNRVRSAIARLALLALSVSSLVSITGCAESFGGASPGYDQQACAERALRRTPDQAVVARAVRAFKADCREGGAEACSALGVMNEMGVGVPANAKHAVALYDLACQAGNARGCANLGVARAQGIGGPRDAVAGARLLVPACDQGDARACGYLGRLFAAGDGVVSDAARASQLFEVACRGEEGSACTSLGDLRAKAGKQGAADELYGKACSLGDASGCKRFDSSGPGLRVEIAMSDRR